MDGHEFSQVDNLIVLGSVVCSDCDEMPAVEYRIKAAWACFHKWSKALLCREASMDARCALWHKTVGRSLLWCMETTRFGLTATAKLQSVQNLMFRKMIGAKRRVLNGLCEPWLDWQVRTLRDAKRAIEVNQVSITACLNVKRNSWASHIARFGTEQRRQHLIKAVLCWRNLFWWRQQQFYNDRRINELRHVYFHPRRWKQSLPLNWLQALKV